MTFPLYIIGTIWKFNGVNIEQIRYYNKVHCATYIKKIVAHHKLQHHTMRKNPIPIQADNKYQKEQQEAVGPSNPTQQKALEQKGDLIIVK